MLAEGRRRGAVAGLTRASWVRGAAEELPLLATARCRLVTFGQSYHWTRRVPVLDGVHELLEPGGAVALIGHCAHGRPEPPGPGLPLIPEDEIAALLAEFVDDETPPPSAGRRSTPHLYEADLLVSRFGHCRIVHAPGRSDIVRDVDSVVAGYYSTSYAAPRRFGARRVAIEGTLRELLYRRSPAGLFWDWPGDTEIVLATRSR